MGILSWLVLTAIAIILFVWAAISGLNEASRRERLFDARSPHAPTDIFVEEFIHLGVSEEQFLAIWNEVARILQVAPSKLRTSDQIRLWVPRVLAITSVLDDLEDFLRPLVGARTQEPGPGTTIGQIVSAVLRNQRE